MLGGFHETCSRIFLTGCATRIPQDWTCFICWTPARKPVEVGSLSLYFTTGFIHPLGFLNHQQYVYHPLVRVSKEPQPFSLQRWFETLMFRVKWWTHPSKVKWHTWRRCITFKLSLNLQLNTLYMRLTAFSNCSIFFSFHHCFCFFCWDILGSGVVVRPNSLSYIGFSGRGSMVCCV